MNLIISWCVFCLKPSSHSATDRQPLSGKLWPSCHLRDLQPDCTHHAVTIFTCQGTSSCNRSICCIIDTGIDIRCLNSMPIVESTGNASSEHILALCSSGVANPRANWYQTHMAGFMKNTLTPKNCFRVESQPSWQTIIHPKYSILLLMVLSSGVASLLLLWLIEHMWLWLERRHLQWSKRTSLQANNPFSAWSLEYMCQFWDKMLHQSMHWSHQMLLLESAGCCWQPDRQPNCKHASAGNHCLRSRFLRSIELGEDDCWDAVEEFNVGGTATFLSVVDGSESLCLPCRCKIPLNIPFYEVQPRNPKLVNLPNLHDINSTQTCKGSLPCVTKGLEWTLKPLENL